MSSYKKIPRADFQEKFKGIPKSGIDLLDKLLQFNPFFRLTLDEAIAHPFFKRVRKMNKVTDKIRGTKIDIDFEKLVLDKSQMR